MKKVLENFGGKCDQNLKYIHCMTQNFCFSGFVLHIVSLISPCYFKLESWMELFCTYIHYDTVVDLKNTATT